MVKFSTVPKNLFINCNLFLRKISNSTRLLQLQWTQQGVQYRDITVDRFTTPSQCT